MLLLWLWFVVNYLWFCLCLFCHDVVFCGQPEQDIYRGQSDKKLQDVRKGL